MTGTTDTLEQLKRALQAHRQALEALEDALIAGLESHARQDSAGRKLLSLKEVCQELGMSKGWVYQQIRRGEIPSTKLGHTIKVKREELEAYLLQARRRESIEE